MREKDATFRVVVFSKRFMQLTWNEDATVFEDEDDILLEEDIVMLELSWLEVMDEDCIEDEDLKDDFCI